VLKKSNLLRIKKFIDESSWVYAKTYPKFPHYYVLRRRARSESDFDFFVGYVFQYGERGHFFRKIFYYLFIDGYKYWIDAEDDGTFIINRAKINGNDYVNKRGEI